MKKQISAEIIADSLAPDGIRLTSFVLNIARISLSELNTHRALSRNSASSRAVPYKKMLEMVREDPFIPLKFQKDHSGMQGTEYFSTSEHDNCVVDWLYARDSAIFAAEHFSHNITKQLKNRLLEPFMWHTVIATATDWQNFFALRANEAAEIHMQELANVMLEAYNSNEPKQLNIGEWHIPFGDKLDCGGTEVSAKLTDATCYDSGVGIPHQHHYDATKVKIATARCARVSYYNFDGKDDYMADLKLYKMLLESGHMSPFEHCAVVPCYDPEINYKYNGNFSGQWSQLRKTIENENRTDERVKIHKFVVESIV